MKDFFKELFAYSHHYNQQLAELITTHPQAATERSVKLFSHILNAHHVWNSRIKTVPSSYKVWEMQDEKNFKAIDTNNYEQTLLILNSVDLEQEMDYTTSNGMPFRNKVKDILFHVTNHSTYHRGQLATEFKSQGIEPLITDYIMFKR